MNFLKFQVKNKSPTTDSYLYCGLILYIAIGCLMSDDPDEPILVSVIYILSYEKQEMPK